MAKIIIQKGYLSIYFLMQALAVFAFVGLWSIYGIEGETEYVNLSVVILASILTAITWFMIKDSRKKQNPLLVVLVLWLLLFVVIRVITLNFTDFSVCLARCGATAKELSDTLFLIIISALALWIGLSQNCKSETFSYSDVRFKPIYVKRAVVFYWIALFFHLVGSMGIPLLSGIAVIIKNFFININNVLFLFLIYVLLVWNRINRRERIICGVTMISFLLILTIGGSRSGIYSVLKMLVFVALTMGYKTIKKKYAYLGIALIPIMLFIFVYSTYMRKTSMRDSTTGEKIELISEAADYSKGLDTRVLFGPVFDRVGFLDYAGEMYVQREKFRSFINIGTEIQSIVDNALSPGFDVFDAPKISNLIANYYEYGKVVFSKSGNSKLSYHSDELTLIGESIVLFGIPLYLVFLFIVGLAFKRAWQRAYRKTNEERFYIRAMILYLFEVLLSSFGIDWFVLDMVSFILTFYIFKWYVYRRESLT